MRNVGSCGGHVVSIVDLVVVTQSVQQKIKYVSEKPPSSNLNFALKIIQIITYCQKVGKHNTNLHRWIDLTFLTYFISIFNRFWSSANFIRSRNEAVYFSESAFKSRKSTHCHSTEDHTLNCRQVSSFHKPRSPLGREEIQLYSILDLGTRRG